MVVVIIWLALGSRVSGLMGKLDFLVWDTPSIVTVHDLIASNISEHSFQAMGVPHLPKVLVYWSILFLVSC